MLTRMQISNFSIINISTIVPYRIYGPFESTPVKPNRLKAMAWAREFDCLCILVELWFEPCRTSATLVQQFALFWPSRLIAHLRINAEVDDLL